MDIERRLYLRLFSFCIGSAMDILSFFIDTCILNNTDFDLFLNQHKHEMFHRWIPTIPCCECIKSVSIAAPNKRSILNISQMKTVYKLDGAEVIGHVKTNHKKETSQHCLCKISAIPGITTETLDIGMMHCLIKTCSSSIFSKIQNHLEVIRNIRNELAHHVKRGIMTEREFNRKWNEMENAVLAIAKEVSIPYGRKEKKLISSLKNMDVNLKDVTDRIELMEENMKQIYEDGTGQLKTTTLEEHIETRKQICQFKEEILQEIKESHMVCRICRRVDVAEIPCRKAQQKRAKMSIQQGTCSQRDAQAIEASCQVTGKNIDEELMLSNLQPENFEQNSDFNIKSAKKKCIILELSSSPEILQSRDNFRRAILSLMTRIEQAGELDSSIPYSIEINLTFNTPLTQDEVRTVSSLSTLQLNGDTAQEMQTDHESKSNMTDEIEVLVERAPIQEETQFDDYDVLPQKGKENEDDLSIEIRKLTFPVKLHGMATEMKSETTETTIYKTEDSDRCQVEWRLRIPDIWKVDQIKQTLENVSQMLHQLFRIEFVYIGGPLVIHTSVPRHVLRDKQCLKSAIQSLLEKIVEVCEINTDVQETVNVDFRVLEMTSNTETVKSEVERFTQLPMYSERESTTDEDTVSCKHCHKQFPCDQCSIRRRQIEFLVTDNRRKTQTIIDMDMEFLKAEPKSEKSNDQEWSQLTQTTETPLELGEPPYKMPRLPGHGEDAETTTSTQLEAEYINWLKKNIEIYKGRVDSLEQSLVNSRRSKARINAKQRQLKQSSKELTMNDHLELVRVQQRFKRQKSEFDTLTKQLRCYRTALQSQGQSTKIGEQFDKGPDATDTEYSDDIMCQLCVSDQRPAVYWCTECVQAMCRECTTVHRTQPTSSTHTPVLLIHDYNFQIKGIRIRDIASLCEGVLIISDYGGKQLIKCDIRGHNKQFIPLPYSPYRLSVIDQNNVAITTYVDEKVLIVDVKQKTVTIESDIKKDCGGITYRDNHLYVGCYKALVKVDMSGEIIRIVPLSFKPWCICSGKEGRLYCTDSDSNTVYCIDTEGNTEFTVTNPDMSSPTGITTDNEGHVLVVCLGSNNVHRISPDGKQCNVIIKDIPLRNLSSPWICYDSISKSVVISYEDTFYVYKE